jgi:hypothetical protein
LAIGHDVIDQTKFMRPLRSEVVTSKQHFGSDGVADLSAKSNSRTSHGKQTALYFGDSEDCALAGDANVGALKNFCSASTGESLGSEDHGLGGTVGLEPATKDDLGLIFESLEPLVVDDTLAQSANLSEIHTGTEGVALPSENSNAQGIIGIETNPRVVQPAENLCIGSILLFGTVDRDDEDRTLGFD